MSVCVCLYEFKNLYVLQGVVFQTTKCNVHAQGTSLQTTEKTSNEAFLNNLFGKSDLQKMFIQFSP